MAFQQPQQRPQPTRPHLSVPEQAVQASPARKRSLEESQEWILFSPVHNPDGQSVSHTSQTPRTATHLSDFGSLDTRGRSQPFGGSHVDDAPLASQGTDIDDEAAELDSLDDGLGAFHETSFSASNDNLDQSGGAVLPTHDGFGTFPSSSGLQDHLWQFERFNPHRRSRHLRRRSSVQPRLDPMEEEQELNLEDERTARIEQWRLEQSRAVLEEIERETRRRRRRLARQPSTASALDTRSVTEQSAISAALRSQLSTSTEESESRNDESSGSESFWRRITRRVIQDLMGLDETTLSVIFGEQLISDPSPTPTQPSPIAVAATKESSVSFNDSGQSWELKLLERIARELGTIVHQLSEHEGAFHTYQRMQETPEYAGLPRDTPRQPSLRQRRRLEQQRRDPTVNPASEGLFTPTVPQSSLPMPAEPADSSLWGIDEEEADPLGANPSQTIQEDESMREREYWERDIDVKMIFNYLKSRFSSAAPEPPRSLGGGGGSGGGGGGDYTGQLLPTAWATASGTVGLGTSPESQRRAEIIRRQHPLVSRAAERAAAAQNRRRESLLLRRHSHLHTLMQRRSVGGGAVAAGGSSCASQSTNRRSRHSRSGSSRHYWDLGGSVGSVGSGGPAMSSGLGGWGEV